MANYREDRPYSMISARYRTYFSFQYGNIREKTGGVVWAIFRLRMQRTNDSERFQTRAPITWLIREYCRRSDIGTSRPLIMLRDLSRDMLGGCLAATRSL